MAKMSTSKMFSDCIDHNMKSLEKVLDRHGIVKMEITVRRKENHEIDFIDGFVVDDVGFEEDLPDDYVTDFRVVESESSQSVYSQGPSVVTSPPKTVKAACLIMMDIMMEEDRLKWLDVNESDTFVWSKEQPTLNIKSEMDIFPQA